MQDDGSLKDINSGYAYFKNIEDARKSHDKIIDERYNNAYKLITENVWRTDSIRDNNNTMPDCYGVLEVKNDGTYAGMVYSSNEGAVLVREVGTYQADRVDEINELKYSPDTKRIYLTFTPTSIEKTVVFKTTWRILMQGMVIFKCTSIVNQTVSLLALEKRKI